MSADRFPLDANWAAGAGPAGAPFAAVHVTITKQEHIRLKTEAGYWKALHRKAVDAARRDQLRHERAVRELKEGAARTEAGLRVELEAAQAMVRDLRKRVFGTKSEGRKKCERQPRDGAAAPKGRRGCAPGHGHGRGIASNLPERHETVVHPDPQCPQCGLALLDFPGTEDAEVVEIEVKAYRRVIHRRRYVPACRCGCLPGIVSAPAPARLIPRGKFGVSVWTDVLLDKFGSGRPSERLLGDWAGRGLDMAASTLAGGLRAIAPLFEPIDQAILAELRGASHWHADETRWSVFADVEDKVGHRWYLWVFHSSSAVHYVLDRTRAGAVVERELAGVQAGIISCDRYSAYKKFASLHPGIRLAFCWAHQRRDFIELANAHPERQAWALAWVDRIGQLYRLNDARLATLAGGAARAAAQAALALAVRGMAAERAAALAAAAALDTAADVATAKVLRSMARHWGGLTVFVDCPWVPMDNNAAERILRGSVVGRKNFYGSGAEWSGQLAATMYGVLATLDVWGINQRTWLDGYLRACADNGNRVPADLGAFLPWAMDAPRLARMRAALPMASVDSS